MNIKCNKNVIYSSREFCIGVQERIYLQNSTFSLSMLSCVLYNKNHKNNVHVRQDAFAVEILLL